MRINVGSGGRPLPGFTNVDIHLNPGVDLVAPAWELGLPDRSVHEIRSHDVIEHLFPKDWPRTLDEFWRVLEPGGTVILSTPDFGDIARGFVEGRYNIDDVRRTVLATVPPFNSVDYDVPESYHRTAHSEESLRADLTARGFIGIQVWREHYNWNMFVRAIKPFSITSELVIVVPTNPGYTHSEAFREIAESVHYGLLAIGRDNILVQETVDKKRNIVFGAHLLRGVPPGSVIYNLEHAGTRSFSDTVTVVKNSVDVEVWDFSKTNTEVWRKIGVNAKIVRPGYVHEIDRIIKVEEQDIDVLFYGSINDRRTKILQDLSEIGLRVEQCHFYGAERDVLIARSKVVLNMHFYEEPGIFESVRVSYLLANGVCVVSEKGIDSDGYDQGCMVVPYEDLVKACKMFVDNTKMRTDLGNLGKQTLKEMFDEQEILKKAMTKNDEVTADGESMLGRWAPWYSSGHRASYGPNVTYAAAEEFLAGLSIEDWGCGYAQFKEVHKGPYVGVDGTPGWADAIHDLRTYQSETEGLMMRHVLEHNPDWRKVLKNAVQSFQKRMVLVVFTPDSESQATRSIAFVSALGVYDLSLPFAEVESFFSNCRKLDRKHFPTTTGYQGETVWFVEK